MRLAVLTLSQPGVVLLALVCRPVLPTHGRSLWHEPGDPWGASLTLLNQAWFSGAQGHAQAARALAEPGLTLAQAAGDRWVVAQVLLEELGVLLMPADRAAHEALFRQLRARPGESQFAAAWAAGQAPGLNEAMELALKAAQPALAHSSEA